MTQDAREDAMPIVVVAMPDLERNLGGDIEQAVKRQDDGPLTIVKVGREELTIFVEGEKKMLWSDWTPLGPDTSRPNKTLHGYRKTLIDAPTPEAVRGLVEQFLKLP